MKQSEHESGPAPVEITFAVWRRAPLAWSLYWIGRQLSSAGNGAADLGERLMGFALDRLTREGR